MVKKIEKKNHYIKIIFNKMFWLFEKNIEKNNKFKIKFLDFEKVNLETDEIYVFKNSNKLLDFNHNINCKIIIKENLIKYKNEKIDYCFRIVDEFFDEDGFYCYEYEKINNECFPNILKNQYDFFDFVNFKIVEKNNNHLLIKEEINNHFRYYEIIY